MEPQLTPPTRPVPPWAPTQPGPLPDVRPPERRIGATERDAAEQRLRQALRDDVLTIMEYDERLGAVMASRTQTEIDALLADLPEPPQPVQGAQLSECASVVAVLGNTEQRGRWRPAKGLRAVAVMGSAKVDLRDAVSDDGVFDITAYAVMGTVEVIVPDDAAVDVSGFSVLGDRENSTADPQAPGVTVRVTGYAVMGEVKVRLASKRERRRFPVPGQGPPATPPTPAVPRVHAPSGWGRRIAAIAVIGLLGAGPIRAVATSDAAVLFGSREYHPTPEQLAGDDDIEVASFFGSIEVVLPEGVYARSGGLQLFGSSECDAPCAGSAEARRVEVEATTMFGSAEIRYPGEDSD